MTETFKTQKRPQEEITKAIPTDLYPIVSDVIGLPITNDWEIVDYNPQDQTCMVHYTIDADKRFNKLRGTVVDLKAKTVIAESHPRITQIVEDKILLNQYQQWFTKDINGNPLCFNFSYGNLELRPAFDGAIIRVIWHQGKMKMSVHHRLDANKANWGGSQTFGEMYRQLNGPIAEELFDTEKKFSPYCHIFIIAHPSLIYLSKQNVGPGYLVYLGHRSVFPNNMNCPFPYDEVDFDLKVPKYETSLPAVIEKPILVKDPLFNVKLANDFLKDGYYGGSSKSIKDERLMLGESVMLYRRGRNGEVEGLYQISSTAYNWRDEMRGGDPNAFHRLCCLSEYAKTREKKNGKHLCDLKTYTEYFPMVSKWDLDQVQNEMAGNPIMVWPDSTKTYKLSSWQDRFDNIVVCFLMSVPFVQQQKIFDAYNEYKRRTQKSIEHLLNAEKDEELNESKLTPYMIEMIAKARQHARLMNHDYDEAIQKTMKVCVYNVTGANFYAMTNDLLKLT